MSRFPVQRSNHDTPVALKDVKGEGELASTFPTQGLRKGSVTPISGLLCGGKVV